MRGKKEKYEGVHEQDYDRWGHTPGAITFTDSKHKKKKAGIKKVTKTSKKKK